MKSNKNLKVVAASAVLLASSLSLAQGKTSNSMLKLKANRYKVLRDHVAAGNLREAKAVMTLTLTPPETGQFAYLFAPDLNTYKYASCLSFEMGDYAKCREYFLTFVPMQAREIAESNLGPTEPYSRSNECFSLLTTEVPGNRPIDWQPYIRRYSLLALTECLYDEAYTGAAEFHFRRARLAIAELERLQLEPSHLALIRGYLEKQLAEQARLRGLLGH